MEARQKLTSNQLQWAGDTCRFREKKNNTAIERICLHVQSQTIKVQKASMSQIYTIITSSKTRDVSLQNKILESSRSEWMERMEISWKKKFKNS